MKGFHSSQNCDEYIYTYLEMKACSEDPPNSIRNCRVQHELTLKYL